MFIASQVQGSAVTAVQGFHSTPGGYTEAAAYRLMCLHERHTVLPLDLQYLRHLHLQSITGISLVDTCNTVCRRGYIHQTLFAPAQLRDTVSQLTINQNQAVWQLQ